MKLVAVLVSLALTAAGCGGGSPPRFNRLPRGAATGPAQPFVAPAAGGSTVTVGGAFTVNTKQDFQCSTAPDDFFVRGALGVMEGTEVYISLNVEFYRNPGRYERRTQVLVRRIAPDNSFYAAWYDMHATVTVLRRGAGADLEPTVLQPEPGGKATGTVSIGGHFACFGRRVGKSYG